MKKVFILIAFLFTVVCFAAPPPDLTVVFPTEEVGFILSQEVTVDFCFDLQPKVAFVYRGDNYVYVYVLALTNDFLMQPDLKVTERIIMNENCLIVSYDNFAIKQHSNYGYPFGGNDIS